MTYDRFRSIASLSASKTHCFSCYQHPVPEIAFLTFISWKTHLFCHPTDTWLPSSCIFHCKDSQSSQSTYWAIQSFVELYSDTTWFQHWHRAKWAHSIAKATHLDRLYQEMVTLHHRNKLQGLSTHRHNARHTLSACIFTISQDLHHTHCHRGPLLLADIIGLY